MKKSIGSPRICCSVRFKRMRSRLARRQCDERPQHRLEILAATSTGGGTLNRMRDSSAKIESLRHPIFCEPPRRPSGEPTLDTSTYVPFLDELGKALSLASACESKAYLNGWAFAAPKGEAQRAVLPRSTREVEEHNLRR